MLTGVGGGTIVILLLVPRMLFPMPLLVRFLLFVTESMS